MRVTITQEHIDKGRAGSFSNCPIALAIYDTIHAVDVRVDKKYMEVYPDACSVLCYKLPEVAQEFIHKFDNYQVVEPFEFDAEYDVHSANIPPK